MLSLKPEIEQLAADGVLPAERASVLVAVEERSMVSVHGLLRFLLWVGVSMIVGGAGVWFAENLEQLGPVVVTIVGLALAGAAYGAAIVMRRRSPEATVAADYVGLLAALLLTAVVAWAESQFVLLANWTHHLLILAAIHAAFAYATGNRLVFTVAVASLSAWFGVDRQEVFDLQGVDGGLRLLAAAGAVLVWRLIHLRFPDERFEPVLENAAVQLAFWGSLIMIANDGSQGPGLIALLLVAVLVGLWIRYSEGHNLQFIWVAIYLLIGIDILIVENVDDGVLVTLWLMISSLAAVFGLITFFIRRREES